jgi:hypothetical protein
MDLLKAIEAIEYELYEECHMTYMEAELKEVLEAARMYLDLCE